MAGGQCTMTCHRSRVEQATHTNTTCVNTGIVMPRQPLWFSTAVVADSVEAQWEKETCGKGLCLHMKMTLHDGQLRA